MNTEPGALHSCPCISGLRAVRCCAMSGDLSPSEATRHLIPLIERAAEAWRVGLRAVAERLCLDVLELAPDRVGALTLLFRIRKSDGNIRGATALVRRIVTLEPNNFWATNELTLLLLANRNLPEALTHARNAVRIAPENAQSHHLLGMAMTEAQQAPVGEYHYRRALELANRRDPVLLANLAWSLKCQGRVEEARALYEESVSVNPCVPQTLLGWAHLQGCSMLIRFPCMPGCDRG
jgi:tetratricopeptide (TPR) repeat protein